MKYTNSDMIKKMEEVSELSEVVLAYRLDVISEHPVHSSRSRLPIAWGSLINCVYTLIDTSLPDQQVKEANRRCLLRITTLSRVRASILIGKVGFNLNWHGPIHHWLVGGSRTISRLQP